jgi:formate hydrogenlyase subunit 6/NADH:ubiquinone oxidoreductase subunit I
MLKHALSELKEAWICLRAGRVTLRYPYEPAPPPPDYRGKPVLDPELCTGCAACAMACPSRTIVVTDEAEHRRIDFQLARCIFCGTCQDVCPEDAVTLTPEFELSTPDKEALHVEARLLLQRCEDCGAVVGTRRQMRRLLQEVGVAGLESWLGLCIRCRRKRSYKAERLGREDRS